MPRLSIHLTQCSYGSCHLLSESFPWCAYLQVLNLSYDNMHQISVENNPKRISKLHSGQLYKTTNKNMMYIKTVDKKLCNDSYKSAENINN